MRPIKTDEWWAMHPPFILSLLINNDTYTQTVALKFKASQGLYMFIFVRI